MGVFDGLPALSSAFQPIADDNWPLTVCGRGPFRFPHHDGPGWIGARGRLLLPRRPFRCRWPISRQDTLPSSSRCITSTPRPLPVRCQRHTTERLAPLRLHVLGTPDGVDLHAGLAGDPAPDRRLGPVGVELRLPASGQTHSGERQAGCQECFRRRPSGASLSGVSPAAPPAGAAHTRADGIDLAVAARLRLLGSVGSGGPALAPRSATARLAGLPCGWEAAAATARQTGRPARSATAAGSASRTEARRRARARSRTRP